MVVLQCHVSVLLFLDLCRAASAHHAIVHALGPGELEATVVSAAKLEHVVAVVVRRDDVLRLVATLVYRTLVSSISLVLAGALAEIRRVLDPLDLGRDTTIVVNLRQFLSFPGFLVILVDILRLCKSVLNATPVVLSIVSTNVAITD